MDIKITMVDSVVVCLCEDTGQLFQTKPFFPVGYLLGLKPSNKKY